VILLGALVALWGALVFGFAPMLHTRWKGMLAEMNRAGVKNDLPGIAFFASKDGLRKMRVAGVSALIVGLGMVALGLAQGRGL
jgi:hypothetical protein